jgi:outer membrane protein assembly factor BamD (BamD/ComL family)
MSRTNSFFRTTFIFFKGQSLPLSRWLWVVSAVAVFSAAMIGCSHTSKFYSFDMGMLAEADVQFKSKNYSQALKQYDEIVRTYPRTASARTALYKIGFIYLYYENPQADWTMALKTFRQFQKEYMDDQHIDEVNTWIRILTSMESFAAKYGESSAKIQKLKTKSLERSESIEQLREEFLRCSFEKDSLNLEKNALIQKIRELEATILKIEKAQ